MIPEGGTVFLQTDIFISINSSSTPLIEGGGWVVGGNCTVDHGSCAEYALLLKNIFDQEGV